MKAKILGCSSPTKEGLLRMVGDYYFTTNLIIKDSKVYNTKLNRNVGEVEHKNNRYYYYY